MIIGHQSWMKAEAQLAQHISRDAELWSPNRTGGLTFHFIKHSQQRSTK